MTKRILAILAVLALTLAVFSGCGQTKNKMEAGFNTSAWLGEDAHAVQLQYIAIFTGKEDYFAADEADQQWILDKLKHVFFAPVETIFAAKNDFAFAMNEPFLYFEFTDDGLLWAKVPPESGRDYVYYEAKLADYEQLVELQARIEELQAAHGAESGMIVGGYSEDRDVTPEDLALFNEVMAGAGAGVSYEPTKVATQVVAGMNYRFTVTATLLVEPPETYTAQITIFKPLQGEPELVGIEKMQ